MEMLLLRGKSKSLTPQQKLAQYLGKVDQEVQEKFENLFTRAILLQALATERRSRILKGSVESWAKEFEETLLWAYSERAFFLPSFKDEYPFLHFALEGIKLDLKDSLSSRQKDWEFIELNIKGAVALVFKFFDELLGSESLWKVLKNFEEDWNEKRKA